MSVLGRFSTLLNIKSKLKCSLESIKQQKIMEAEKINQIEKELKEVIVEINPKNIVKILKRKPGKRTRKEIVILYGFSMRYPILKKIAGLLLLDNYLGFINTFKLYKIKAKNVIFHIGDVLDSKKGFFLVKGRVDCYNFKHKNIDITN
jgi:tetrahydromethanopterin S-methyltransferase subunit G